MYFKKDVAEKVSFLANLGSAFRAYMEDTCVLQEDLFCIRGIME